MRAPYPDSPWNDPVNVDYLTTEWKIGKSATGIAAALTRKLDRHVTRGAVIGRLSRMGLIGLREKATPKKRGGMSKPTRDLNRTGKILAKTLINADRAMPALREIEAPMMLVPFIERTAAQCSWPIGEPSYDMLCCGRTVGRGAYCLEHYEVAHQPTDEVSEGTQRHYAGLGNRAHADSGRYAEPTPLDRMAA